MNFFSLKRTRKATVIAEFNKDDDALTTVCELSNYIHDICNKDVFITTDLQSHPAGYRITFIIAFPEYYHLKFRNRKNYSKELAKLSDWLSKTSKTKSLFRYHYNITAS